MVMKIKCRNCGSKDIVKAGFQKRKNSRVQKYKCKECLYNFTLSPKYTKVTKNITLNNINYLRYEKSMSLRQIAKSEGVALSTIQYHIKKASK